ncbi:uncharacterized protein PEZ65_011189 [Lycodopsis pacificus]
MVYRYVFNKVIGRAAAYKRLLLTIKGEYDDVIGALQRREDEARTAQRTLVAITSHPKSLMTCQRRAAHLRDRWKDCMWVLNRSPSLSLLQLLRAPQQGRAAILSLGVACSTLLADPQQQQFALQLLDSAVSKGRVWSVVASLCSELNRADLSRAVLSVLLDQSGTRIVTPGLEGALLMEHVFL